MISQIYNFKYYNQTSNDETSKQCITDKEFVEKGIWGLMMAMMTMMRSQETDCKWSIYNDSALYIRLGMLNPKS